MSQKFITDNTIAGHCACCGRCCSDVLLVSKEEQQKIKDYIKKNEIKPVNRNSILENKPQVDICPFLNERKLCNIYEVRPEICSRFLCSEFCKKKESTQDYLKVEVISMTQTFFPEVKLAQPYDLTLTKNNFEKMKKGLKSKK